MVPWEPCWKDQSLFPIGLNGGTGNVVLHRITPTPAVPPSLASTTANCWASSLNKVVIVESIVNYLQRLEIDRREMEGGLLTIWFGRTVSSMFCGYETLLSLETIGDRKENFTRDVVTGNPWSGRTTPLPSPVITLLPAKATFSKKNVPGLSAFVKDERRDTTVRTIICEVTWTIVGEFSSRGPCKRSA